MTVPDLSQDFFDFIDTNIKADPLALRLKYHGRNPGFDVDFAITQIECRRKCSSKLRSFIARKEFIFPTVVAAEQASNEAVALFHARLVKKPCRLLDMTAGLGIDAMTMALSGADVTACELDPLKAAALRHNAAVARLDNFTTVCADSVEYLRDCTDTFDTIFIDPARRGEFNSRVYNLKDCQPEIPVIIGLLLSRCSRLIIKASPLLDITQTLRDFSGIRAVRAVSVGGECKEVLIEIAGNATEGMPADSGADTEFEAVDLDNEGNVISSFKTTEPAGSGPIAYADAEAVAPGCLLFEPNASMMKLAPWREIQRRHPSLRKLSPSSQLFAGPEHIPDFPGRRMIIEKVIEKKDRKTLKDFPASVVSRNYPVSAAELRKQLKLREGDEHFIYATRLASTPMLILCRREG